MAKPPSKQQMLRSALLERIAEGVYSDKLPGMQALAEEFSVNVKTVNKAVRSLVAEGVIENRGPRGTFVARGPAGPLRIPEAWNELDAAIYEGAIRTFSRGSAVEVVAGGGVPAVVKANASSVRSFAESFYPLDGFPTEKILRRLMPEATEFYRHDGRLYGLPLTVSPYLIYYSVEHLAKLGLARPGPFERAADFLYLCRRLVDEAGARYAFAAHARLTYTMPFLWQAGVKLIDDGGLRGRLDAPEVRDIFELYAELFRGSPSGIDEQSYAPALEAFLAGELAMMAWGGHMERWLDREPRGRFGVCALEIAGRRDTLLFSEGFAIACDAESPELAWRFLEAIYSPEAQEAYVKSGLQIPAYRPGARPTPEIHAQMLAHAQPAGRRIPAELMDLVTAEWKGFLAGDEPYEAFAARLSPALDVLLAHIAREREWAERAIRVAPAGPDPRHWSGS